MTDADGVYELREQGSSRVWQFFPVTGDTVRIKLVWNDLPMGACERWVLKTAFKRGGVIKRGGVEVPWNPFGRGYSFLNFRMDYHPTYETHYCEVEFHRSDGHTVYMDTGDARILWASIVGDKMGVVCYSLAAHTEKNRKGATPPQIA